MKMDNELKSQDSKVNSQNRMNFCVICEICGKIETNAA